MYCNPSRKFHADTENLNLKDEIGRFQLSNTGAVIAVHCTSVL